MTVSGKLDKRALPAPEYQVERCLPRAIGPTEEILAGIYAQVLGLERVGVDDSFFDLGGDSLLAMRVIAAINTSLDSGLAVRTLFDAPTVAQLAPRIGEGSGRRNAVGVRQRPAVVPLSFAQQRLWFLNRFEGGVATYNMPIAFRIDGDLDVDGVGCGARRRDRPARVVAHGVSRSGWGGLSAGVGARAGHVAAWGAGGGVVAGVRGGR